MKLNRTIHDNAITPTSFTSTFTPMIPKIVCSLLSYVAVAGTLQCAPVSNRSDAASHPNSPAAGAGINESLLGHSDARSPLDPGLYTSDGWKVTSEDSQLRWDLGRQYESGTVEFEVRGDLHQEDKRVLLALWNVPEGAEEDATHKPLTKPAFFQVRLVDEGMMLRLTARGQAKTIEMHTGLLQWPEPTRWVHIKATFTTRNGGMLRLWRDGVELRHLALRGNVSPGFRYVFLGKDNYGKAYVAVPGFMFRNLKIYDLKEMTP